MSSFDHAGLIQNINEGLLPLKKAQPEALQAFGQLARSAMAEGSISAKNKELMALAIGITQHCSGCIGFHVKALHKLQCTRTELEEMLSVCVHGWRTRPYVRSGNRHGMGSDDPHPVEGPVWPVRVLLRRGSNMLYFL